MNHAPAALTARKQPKQARSARMVELLLEAAARVLEEQGLEGFNTNAVAHRAGVSVGSLYQYFPHKEAMTAALIMQAHQAVIDDLVGLIARTEGQLIDEVLLTVIRSVVAQMNQRPALSRILEFEEERLPRSEALHAAEAEIQRLNSVLLAPYFRPGLSAEEVDAAAFDVVSIIRGMLDSLSKQHGAAPETLAPNVARTVLGYLEPLLAGEGRGAATDAW